ncbi:MAG: PIG-L family deacetylase [Candidatus Parcubacteria bacterium]|nr:PIG-L family deacetylase [Candidatus Parcubacteria bacterium]
MVEILKITAGISRDVLKILVALFSLLFLFGVVNYFLIGRKLENWLILLKILRPENQIEEPTSTDRILIVAPHPDDETLGMGGYIQRAKKGGAQVKVIYLTLGDHNEIAAWIDKKNPLLTPSKYRQLGEKRAQEAINGTSTLGLKREDLVFLGYPDSGTLKIWQSYWNGRSFLNPITATNKVPYEIAQTPKAAYNAKSIMSDLSQIIDGYKPTKVFAPMNLDSHPDHQAAYLFTQAVVNVLWPKPQVYAYLVHQHYYPEPLRYAPYNYLVPPSDITENYFNYANFNLTKAEEDIKYSALSKYNTQMRVGHTLKSFIRQNEIFLKDKESNLYYTGLVWSDTTTDASVMLDVPLSLPTNYAFGYLGKGFRIQNFEIINDKNDINLLFKIHFTGKINFGSSLYLYFYPQYSNLDFKQTPKYLIVISNNIRKSVRVIDLSTAKKEYFDLDFVLKGQNIEFKFSKANLPTSELIGAFTAFKGYVEKLRVYVTPWQWHNL